MNISAAAMEEAADRASELLKALANRHRLLIVCQLIDRERSVGELADFLGIRNSTVSQHLALLRRDGIVAARRDGQTIWYSISSAPAREVLKTLYRVFCASASSCAPAPRARPAAARRPGSACA
jgi:DNA-binding transcriptional ArsR family regulator